MEVNKFAKGFTAIALSGLVPVACDINKKDSIANSSSAASLEMGKSTGSSAPAKRAADGSLKDGTCKLEEKNEKDGYRAVFKMTVEDGRVTESKYDNINADGESKTEDTKYEENMRVRFGAGPEEYARQLNDSSVKAQSASDVEAVTGTTHLSEPFRNYAQQLIQVVQTGNIDTIEVDNGATLRDGTYSLKEKNDLNGYHTTFSMTVKGGKVTRSNCDNVNADGKSKRDDTEYGNKMKNVADVGPKEYIKTLNKEFAKATGEEDGSPVGVEVITGATHSTYSFISYTQQLVNAAEKGDTTEIIVDSIVIK